jgi:hypothetical protein
MSQTSKIAAETLRVGQRTANRMFSRPIEASMEPTYEKAVEMKGLFISVAP